MARTLVVVAAVFDLGLAALLIAVSGFIVGSGPESMNAASYASAGWTALVVFCLVAPIVGFLMLFYRKPVGGILIAWLPPIAALIGVLLPPSY